MISLLKKILLPTPITYDVFCITGLLNDISYKWFQFSKTCSYQINVGREQYAAPKKSPASDQETRLYLNHDSGSDAMKKKCDEVQNIFHADITHQH